MRERPILFSGPMVRAILNGTKTQTRRVAKPVRHPGWGNFYDPGALAREPQHTIDLACPYGPPGHRLWVRETWSSDFAGHYPHDRVWYAADDDRRHDIEVREGTRGIYSPESQQFVPFRWRPSIHMPRSVCRLVLEITRVRVERLQAINHVDAIAEGVGLNPSAAEVTMTTPAGDSLPRVMFRALWEQINGAGSWAANPWVWVVEFRVLGATDNKEQ